MTTTPVNWLTEIVVNDAPNETGSQTQPRITELRDGRILVSWQDNTDNYDSFVNADFIGQLFEMDGTPIGNPFVLNTVYNGGTTYPNNTTERNHEIAATPDGGFMIVYEDLNVSTSFIRAERFDANGARIANYSIASGSNANVDNVSNPAIHVDENGDWIITFTRRDGNGYDTRGVAFENNVFLPENDYGSRSETGVGSTVPTNDTDILSNGNIVTVNTDFASISLHTRVNVRITQPDGTNVTSFLTETNAGIANTFELLSPQVSALPNGGFAVTYSFENNSTTGIRAALYSNTGSTLVSPFFVDSGATYGFSDIVGLDDGGFVIAWEQDGNLHLRRYSSSGSTVGSEIQFSTINPSGSFDLTLTQDGRVMLAWVEDSQVGLGIGDPISFRIFDVRDNGITVTGTSGIDALTTPIGGGTVNAGAGADNVMGHDGNDTFIDTDLASGDQYDGRGGVDTIDYSSVTFAGSTTIDLVNGTVINSFSGLFDYLENIENVIGSQAGETIRTVFGTTFVDAQGGNDTVIVNDLLADGDSYNGGGGTDTFDVSGLTQLVASEINLSTGTWSILGGTEGVINFENYFGTDNSGVTETIIGTSAANELRGNGGDDIIRGAGGADLAFGGEGNDRFEFDFGDLVNGETVDGGNGIDEIRLTGLSGNFVLSNITTLSSIEQFRVDINSGTSTLNFAAGQFGSGIASNAQFIGGAGSEQMIVFMVSSSTLNLNGLTFTNWNYNGVLGTIQIIGDNSNESITGSILADNINGSGGNDTIDGGAGLAADHLEGGGGINTVSYVSATSAVTVSLANQLASQDTIGAGLDYLQNFDNLTGSQHDDFLYGDVYGNTINGGAGNDTIDGGGLVINQNQQSERLLGGTGDDRIYWRPSLSSFAGEYDGGGDTDTLIGIGLTSADTVNFATGWMVINGVERDKLIDFENYEGSGNENFIGGNEANVVTFTGGGGNVIDTGGGADTVYAGAASDTITGGTGLDMLFGEAGNDVFQIAASHIVAGETMDGGLNDDTIRALGTGIFDLRNVTLSQIENIEFGLGSGSVEFRLTAEQISSGFQTIIGNANSADTLFIDLAGKDSVSLASLGFAIWHPGDRIIISGSNNDDTIEGSIKDDTIEGGAGADNLNGGANTAVGDTLSYAGSNAGVTVFLASNTVSGGHADGDNVTGFENVTGSGHVDYIYGDTGANTINGNGGADWLYGGGGDDTMNGGAGADLMFGEAGSDIMNGGADGDYMWGGSESDTMHGDDGVDWLRGEEGVDYLYGDAGDDVLIGGSGDDQMYGGIDTDTFYGEDDNDWIYGEANGDVAFGQLGDDHIYGGSEGDFLFGGAGADVINGGTENDLMWGDMPGTYDGFADTFEFDANWGFDAVYDFELGKDLVHFNSIAGLTQFSNLTLIDGGANVTVVFGGDAITFYGVTQAELEANQSDFSFV